MNIFGVITSLLFVVVFFEPDKTKTNSQEASEPYIAHERQDFVFTFNLSFPSLPHNYTVRKDGKLVRDDKYRISSRPDIEIAKFILRYTSLIDAGQYVITENRPEGADANHNFQLIVEEGNHFRRKRETTPLESLFVGSDYTGHFVYYGTSESVRTSLYKDSRPLKQDKKHSIQMMKDTKGKSDKGSNSQIIEVKVKNLTMADAGNYMLKIEPKSEKEVTLNFLISVVKEPEINIFMMINGQHMSGVSKWPVSNKSKIDVYCAAEGESSESISVMLTCPHPYMVRGFKNVQISFYFQYWMRFGGCECMCFSYTERFCKNSFVSARFSFRAKIKVLNEEKVQTFRVKDLGVFAKAIAVYGEPEPIRFVLMRKKHIVSKTNYLVKIDKGKPFPTYGVTLKMPGLKFNDSGDYSFIVGNNIGDDEYKFVLDVEEAKFQFLNTSLNNDTIDFEPCLPTIALKIIGTPNEKSYSLTRDGNPTEFSATHIMEDPPLGTIRIRLPADAESGHYQFQVESMDGVSNTFQFNYEATHEVGMGVGSAAGRPMWSWIPLIMSTLLWIQGFRK